VKTVEIGHCTLIHADCMDVMRDLPDKAFDLAIVDPPYGIKRDKGFGGFGGFGGVGKPIARKTYKGNWDNETPGNNYFENLLRVTCYSIVWGGNFFTDKLPQNNHWIFWDKLNTMPTFGDGELAWTNINKNSVKRHKLEYNGLLGKEVDRIHPTQKPVKLYGWLLTNYAKSGQTILDTHLGSGSSAIAANKLGFKFTGIELDEDYFNAACERIANAYKQTSLFDSEPESALSAEQLSLLA
jgi:site-specific DNA-methyltransferase (adenine-specific)